MINRQRVRIGVAFALLFAAFRQVAVAYDVDDSQKDWHSDWQSETRIRLLKDEEVELPCRHFPNGVLAFTARQSMNGTTLNCYSGSNSKQKSMVVVEIVDCVARFALNLLNPKMVKVDFSSSACSNSIKIVRFKLEFDSAHEYRRLTFDDSSSEQCALVSGLSPDTKFAVKLTIETADDTFTSNPRNVKTKPKGFPSMPRLSRLRPKKRHRQSKAFAFESPYEFGLDVSFSLCDDDVQYVREYVFEVSMWENFTSIIFNFTANSTQDVTWWDSPDDGGTGDSLAENGTYYVRVKAVGTEGESLYSAASAVQLTADATSTVSPQEDFTASTSAPGNNNLLFSTIILAVLFVVSGAVALYLILYLRYRKQQARMMESHDMELKKIDLMKIDAAKKDEEKEKKAKKTRRRVSDVDADVKTVETKQEATSAKMNE